MLMGDLNKRNRKGGSRRGKVHGLIRVAINNLGPDI